MTFATYEDLLDAARQHDGLWSAVTRAVYNEGVARSREKYGKFNARGVEKYEKLAAEHFKDMVNSGVDAKLSDRQIADLILWQSALAKVAWAVAQALKEQP